MTIDLTLLVRPEGSTITRSPCRIDTGRDLSGISAKIERRPDHVLHREAHVFAVVHLDRTVSRRCSNVPPRYHGVRGLCVTTLSPSSALIGMK